ncbi:MAG: LPS ABC transporter substrate-binding protein LptA, partial [Brevundimonas sp.]|nr:LPS ABC transporter substrate-binding protein LptA [Brevundimonas sp.]
MSMSGYLKTAAIALALTALPTIGDAQTASRDPIMWTARTVEYVGATLTLRGDAELVQGDNRLRANQIAGFSLAGDSRIEASGDVYFVTPDQTIRGDRATYNTADETIVLTGDVILTQGENVMTGSRLTYNIRSETARFEGGASGRVQGVFYP